MRERARSGARDELTFRGNVDHWFGRGAKSPSWTRIFFPTGWREDYRKQGKSAPWLTPPAGWKPSRHWRWIERSIDGRQEGDR